MDDLNIMQLYIIWANFVIFFTNYCIFLIYFLLQSVFFRCIVHKNDIKLKYNLKHNLFWDCPVSPCWWKPMLNQRFPVSKPGTGQNIAGHAARADRTSTHLVSACPIHSTYVFPKRLRPSPQQWHVSIRMLHVG